MREMEAKLWGVWGGPVDVCREMDPGPQTLPPPFSLLGHLRLLLGPT